MAQQNIDFGSFPDDPDADAIRTAFQKVQNNFSELYTTTTAGSVTSVNRGAGITVNSTTGNVIVTANLACLQVSTSSLSIGQGGNGSSNATISQTSQTLVLDINPANVFSANFSGVSGALANITGTFTSNSNSQPNITSVGTLTNLAVTGNITASNVYANTGTIGATTLIGTLNANSNSQPNITTIGTLGNLNVTTNSNLGNLATANFFSGDGHLLSNLTISAGSSITNGNSNVTVSANGNVTTTVAGIANVLVVTSTGANVTGYLTASGNITGGNANLGNAVTASYFIGNLYGNANTATTAGTVTTNAQPNITSVGTLSALTVTANVTSGNVYANSGIVKGQYLYGDGSNISNITISAGSSIVNGTSNVSIPASNGNVNTVVAGNTTLVVTGTGVNVAGTLNATGSVTGNFAGNVTNATQANITSLGTLTGLNVNGLSNLGPVGNVTITGGSANYYLMTNGSGGLSWTNALLTPIPGSNTQVLFNDAGAANASSSLTFNKTNGLLTATLLGGTLTTNAQTNITSVGPLTSLTVQGNINTANSSVTGTLTVTANVTSPQLISNIATGTAPLVVTSTTQVANLNVATAGLATFATTANAVAGANVSGAVTYATTANAVAGANVSGTVSSATTAGTVTTAAQPNITSTGTLTSLSIGSTGTSLTTLGTVEIGTGIVGDILLFGSAFTGQGRLNTSGSNLTMYSSSGYGLRLGTNGSLTNGIQISTSGVVSTTGNLSVGGILTTTTITTGANSTAGTITGNWSLSAGSRLTATYADLAEKYVADANYQPGTVLVFGGEQEVTVSTDSDSFRVAGVVTTNPAYTMNNDCVGEHVATIALQGRVPVKVIGPVFKGDLLVSCNNGYAIANNIARAGTIIGKSLENFTDASGVIEVAIGRF